MMLLLKLPRMADGALVKWRLHKCWRKRGGVTSSFELIGDGCGISSLRDSGIHFLFGVNLNAAINKWNAADAAGSSKKNPNATKNGIWSGAKRGPGVTRWRGQHKSNYAHDPWILGDERCGRCGQCSSASSSAQHRGRGQLRRHLVAAVDDMC